MRGRRGRKREERRAAEVGEIARIDLVQTREPVAQYANQCGRLQPI